MQQQEGVLVENAWVVHDALMIDQGKEAADLLRWLSALGFILTAGVASGLTLAFFSLDLLELEVGFNLVKHDETLCCCPRHVRRAVCLLEHLMVLWMFESLTI